MRSVIGAAVAVIAMLCVPASAVAAPPDTTIDSIRAHASYMPGYTLEHTTFSSDQPGATFECQFNNDGWFPCTSGLMMASPWDEGETLFQVRASFGGETDPTPAQTTFVFDQTPPVATLHNEGAMGKWAIVGLINYIPAVKASATDNLLPFTWECRVMGPGIVPTWEACALNADGEYHMPDLDPSTGLPFADHDAGMYTINVRAKDLAGNTAGMSTTEVYFSLDRTPPVVTMTDEPPASQTSTTASFAWGTVEAHAYTAECRIDAEPAAPCGGSVTYNDLAEGEHTFTLVTTDEAANETTTVRTFRVDRTDPALDDVTGPSGPIATTDPQYAFTVTVTDADPAATAECQVDAGPWTPCDTATSHTFAGLADGAHTLRVRAKDPAGNTSTPVEIDVTVYSAPPETTLVNGPAAVVFTDEVTVEFASDTPGGTFQCSLNGAPFEVCASPLTLSNLSEGSHTLHVRAHNPAGTPDPTFLVVTFEVDTIAPTVTMDSGPDGPTSNASPVFAFTADDPAATFECRLSGDPWAACVSPHALADLPEGDHTLEIRATDPHGQTGPTVARSFTIDQTSPSIVLDDGPVGATATDSPAYTFTVSDATSAVAAECKADAGAWAPCDTATGHTFSGLADGAHTLSFRAVDAAGNTSPELDIPVTVYTSAPKTSLTSGPAAAVASDEVTFEFSSDIPDSTFECKLDTDPWQACASAYTFSGLAEGPHELRARAVNPAGTPDPDPLTIAFTVDTVPPVLADLDGPTGAIATGSPAYTFTVTDADPDAIVECRVDGGAWASCDSTSEHTFAGLADGAHTLSFRARDTAGNTSAVTDVAVSVHTAVPETSLTGGPGAAVAADEVTVEFSSDSPDATFECALDDDAWAACSSPHTVSDLAEGDHLLKIRAVNPAGTPDPTPLEVAFTVDTIAPVIDDVRGPTGAIATDSPAYTFTVTDADPDATAQCRVDAGAWAACDSASGHTFTGLADGAHTLSFRAQDTAGNTSAVTDVSVAVHTVVPQTTLVSGPAAAVAADEVTVEFSSDLADAPFECKLDTDPWAACTSPHTVSGLAEGAHELKVRAVNPAGTPDPTPLEVAFTVDTVAPVLGDLDGPTGAIATDSPAYTFTVADADPAVVVECRVDGAAWAACDSASGHTFTGLADGAHTLSFRATDAAGNTSAVAEVSVAVHTVVPQTTLVIGPAAVVFTDEVTVEFDSDTPGGTFECDLDGDGWRTCTSPLTLTGLAEGAHELLVRAVNPAGAPDPTPLTVTFAVDTVKPTVTITRGPNGPTNDPSPSFEFAADDPAATFECRLSGDPWAACASPLSFTDFAEGVYRLEIRATDPHGQTGPTVSRNFEVDVEPPAQPVVRAPGAPTPDPVFELVSDDPDVTFECSANFEPWEGCETVYAPVLEPGEHDIGFRALDPAGNVSNETHVKVVVVARSSAAPPQPGLDAHDAARKPGDPVGLTVLLSGDAAARGVLQCDVQTHGPYDSKTPLTYVWEADREPIPGRNGPEHDTYKVRPSDRGKLLRCVVELTINGDTIRVASDEVRAHRQAAKPRVVRVTVKKRVAASPAAQLRHGRQVRWTQTAAARARVTVKRCAATNAKQTAAKKNAKGGCRGRIVKRITVAGREGTNRLTATQARKLRFGKLDAGRHRVTVRVGSTRRHATFTVAPARLP